MAHLDEVDALRLVPELAQLRRGILEALAFAASRETIAAGETVAARGATAREIWLLVAGALERGAEEPARLDAPAVIGAAEALGGNAYAADIRALEPSAVLRVDIAHIERLAAAEPDFAVALARIAARDGARGGGA